jgi:hypothetical protein
MTFSKLSPRIVYVFPLKGGIHNTFVGTLNVLRIQYVRIRSIRWRRDTKKRTGFNRNLGKMLAKKVGMRYPGGVWLEKGKPGKKRVIPWSVQRTGGTPKEQGEIGAESPSGGTLGF